MPLNKDIKKVLVIGSGPIIIGQAAEFDYAGTQACRSLKEEGIEVVLVNSNPATIMTDERGKNRIGFFFFYYLGERGNIQRLDIHLIRYIAVGHYCSGV